MISPNVAASARLLALLLILSGSLPMAARGQTPPRQTIHVAPVNGYTFIDEDRDFGDELLEALEEIIEAEDEFDLVTWKYLVARAPSGLLKPQHLLQPCPIGLQLAHLIGQEVTYTMCLRSAKGLAEHTITGTLYGPTAKHELEPITAATAHAGAREVLSKLPLVFSPSRR